MAGSIAKRPDGRRRARYREDAGQERSRQFARKIDASAWLDEVTSALHTGTYVNPRAGNVTFQLFYGDWAPRQLWVPSTRANADLAVGSVSFGELPLKAIRRSHIETWVNSMSTRWAATTIKTRFVIVRSVFRAAVADRVIAADPTVAQVGLLLAHADSTRVSTRHGFRAYVALCAFAGLRKGEAAGVQRPPARPAAFLRLRADRCWLRRGHRPAGAGARVGDHNAEHLQPRVADGGGQDAGCRLRVDGAGSTCEPVKPCRNIRIIYALAKMIFALA